MLFCYYLFVLIFSGKVERRNKFEFYFSPLIDVPKEVVMNVRKFPEKGLQIREESKWIIYQHI